MPGVVATTARAAFTRARRSRSCRVAARWSASRESSGRPLVISRRLNCRVGVAISSASSPSSGLPNATRDSNRVRVRDGSHHAGRARASRPEAPGGDPRAERAGRSRAANSD